MHRYGYGNNARGQNHSTYQFAKRVSDQDPYVAVMVPSFLNHLRQDWDEIAGITCMIAAIAADFGNSPAL